MKLFCTHAFNRHNFCRKIIPEQHGFMKGRSTETNLCSFLHQIVPSVHSGGQADVVYFDMSKAFDKVNHRLPLSKLCSYGLSLKYCCLLDSYLSHRLNFVRVSGRLSAPFFIYSWGSSRQ
uniref:Putative jockey ele1 orf2-h 1e-120-j 4 n=1 Tax=Ixodes ricinus TaxID=34613 RepID=A0A0K8R608_IXORI